MPFVLYVIALSTVNNGQVWHHDEMDSPCSDCVCRVEAKKEDSKSNQAFARWFSAIFREDMLACPTQPPYNRRCTCQESPDRVTTCSRSVWKLQQKQYHKVGGESIINNARIILYVCICVYFSYVQCICRELIPLSLCQCPCVGSVCWVRVLGPCVESVCWVRVLGPCVGSVCWVRVLGPCVGSVCRELMHLFFCQCPCVGSVCWVRVLGPCVGSVCWVCVLGPCVGSVCWVQVLGPCVGSRC